MRDVDPIIDQTHRHSNGRFRAHGNSTPEQTLGPHLPTPAEVPLTFPHVTEERHGIFRRRRQITRQLHSALRLRHLPADAGEIGERGERIIDGQAYLPVLRDGAPAAADSAALRSLAAGAYGDVSGLDRDFATAQRQFDRHARRHSDLSVIIDGFIWIRASRRSWVST